MNLIQNIITYDNIRLFSVQANLTPAASNSAFELFSQWLTFQQ